MVPFTTLAESKYQAESASRLSKDGTEGKNHLFFLEHWIETLYDVVYI